MRIAISCETTADLPKQLIKELDIKVIPYKIVTKESTFDDGEMSAEELFKVVDRTNVLPKTNAINEFEYTEYFENLRKEYDAVIHVCLSSGLSSSCSNAERASKNVDNVYVVDSQSLATGIALLVIYARKLADEGVAPEEIAQKLNARKDKLQVTFVIERLDYLYKGGRCNSLQLLGANLLKIRPQIEVMNGKMGSTNKFRGKMGKCVTEYCNAVLSKYNNPDKAVIFITHSHATDEMINSAKDIVYELGFKKVYVTTAGCTISSHCGKNTLGILYINDGLTK